MKSKIAVGVLVVFICVCAFIGERMKLYDTIWWWDVMLHAVSGIAAAMVGFIIAANLGRSVISPFFAALFAFTFATTIAVTWEIYEFIIDSIRHTNMQRWQFMPVPGNIMNYGEGRSPGLIDTMKDLIIGIASGLLTAVVGYIYLKKIGD